MLDLAYRFKAIVLKMTNSMLDQCSFLLCLRCKVGLAVDSHYIFFLLQHPGALEGLRGCGSIVGLISIVPGTSPTS